MAAPFDDTGLSTYGQYIQLEAMATTAEPAASASVCRLYASGSGNNSMIYFVNATGSKRSLDSLGGSWNLAGDNGSAQTISNTNTATFVGGLGIETTAAATDKLTVKVNMTELVATTAVADADLVMIDDGAGGNIRKMTRGNLVGSADILPNADNTIDLGNGSTRFAQAHIQQLHADTLGQALDANGQNVANINNLDVDGACTFNGAVTLGDAVGDITTATGRLTASAGMLVKDNKPLYFGNDEDAMAWYDEAVADIFVISGSANGVKMSGSLVPGLDDLYSLGTSALQWKDLHLDGTANIDSLVADTADINAGTIDNTVIGGTTRAAGSFTTLDANGNVVLGDASSDTLTVNADLASDLIPSADNSHDLGDGSNRYAQAHIVALHADTLGQALDANSQNITNVNTFEVDGGATFNGAVTLGDAAADVTTVTGQLTASIGALFVDDKPVYFGTQHDSAIKYDEASSNKLVISGSLAGIGLVGSVDPMFGSTYDIGNSTRSFKDLYIDSMGKNWTNAGRTVADMGSVTTIDINGGTVDNISSLTAAGNLDIGAHDFRAATLTADGLTATRVVFAGANGVLSDDSDLTFSGDTLTATKIGAFEAAGAINFASQAMTNVDINSGNIDGTVIGAASVAAGSFAAVVGTTGTYSGVLKTDDTTEATTTTDGSLQTDGGLSVAKSAVIGDDLDLLSDSAIINIGSSSKFTLTDQAANNCVMASSGHRLAFGNAGEYISGDGTDLLIVSSADVKVTGDLIPSADDTYDLGTTTAAWQDLHLEGDVLFTDAGKVSTAAGTLTLQAAGSNDDIAFTGNDGGSAITALTLDMSEAGAATFNAGVVCTTVAVAGASVSGDIALALPSGKDAKARAFITYSERSLKTNIEPMTNALQTITKMQGYSYDLKDGGKHEVGFMADEMAKVVPEVVQFHDDGTAAGLDYGRLTSILVEAVKSQQVQIEELKSQLKK